MIDPIAETRHELLFTRAEAAYAAQERRRAAEAFAGVSSADLARIAASVPATVRGLEACKLLEVRCADAEARAYESLTAAERALPLAERWEIERERAVALLR